jgi:hypothetical protein
MKRILTILFCFSGIILCGQNISEFRIVDSTKFYNKVDSLKKDKHTEFAFSTFLIDIKTDQELDLVVNMVGNIIYPKKYVLVTYNRTYYPNTEYINDGTDKKFNNTFVYIKNNNLEKIIYLLSPSGIVEN